MENEQVPINFGKKDESICENCGAKKIAYWHSLTPGLVNTFKKFVDTVKQKGINNVHLQTDMELSKNEYNNFQKLRYWGLVHHAKKNNVKSGCWLVTRNGGSFLRGEMAMSKKIKTFRNEIEEKSDEVVWIFDYYRAIDREYWQREYKMEIFQGKLI